MADDITTCPYCAEEIRVAAIKCKHCGSDLTAASAASVQTIEQTGKTYKALQAVGVIAVVLGLIIVFGGGIEGSAAGFGGLLLFGGLVATVFARMGAWWHHS